MTYFSFFGTYCANNSWTSQGLRKTETHFGSRQKAISKIESLNNFITKKTSEKKQLVTTTSYSYSQSTEGSKDIPDSEGQRVANALKFYKSPSTFFQIL